MNILSWHSNPGNEQLIKRGFIIMNKKNDKLEPPFRQLRQEAEAALNQSFEISKNSNDSDSIKILHELQVHKIELEMQNQELRQAHAIMELSRDQLRDRYLDLYDFAPVGYLTLNHQNLITEINLTAARLLGEERKKLMLRRFMLLVATENRDDCHRFLQYAQQYAGRQTCELKMLRSDGSEFDARLDCLRVEDREWRIAFTDITDLKRNQSQLTEQTEKTQKLREANRCKDEFLAMLAHELRNPLAPIRNSVEILKHADVNPERLAWCTSIIERQVEHLVRMMDDLLDVSRISHGMIELKMERLPIRDFILPAVETCQQLIDTRRQTFRLEVPQDDLWVAGDRIRLTQVISNLINNAAKYTHEGGHIELKAELSGDDVCIHICDSGCGIDPKELPHLFELFYQVDRSIDRSQGGLGIGLSLVHKLVVNHGGNIQAFSKGLGQGSDFVIRLPRLIMSPSTAAPITAVTAAPSSNKLRILVVDDNRDAAESLALLLKNEGHQVLTEFDGISAYETARTERPDLILLDIGLPGMDGYAVAHALRQDHELERTRLIALSGYGQSDDREKSSISGFDEHWVKPVGIEKLRILLAKLPHNRLD
ncbi:MAG: ATP-binding protein [Methylomonas sp.]